VTVISEWRTRDQAAGWTGRKLAAAKAKMQAGGLMLAHFMNTGSSTATQRAATPGSGSSGTPAPRGFDAFFADVA